MIEPSNGRERSQADYAPAGSPASAPAAAHVRSGHAAGATNIATACCDRLADGSGRLALLHRRADGQEEAVSFDALSTTSSRLAGVLRRQGVRRGERVGVLLPQGPEALIAHLAVLRLGGITVPLAGGLPSGALAARLGHAGCTALVTDAPGLAALAPVRHWAPALRLVLCADGAAADALSLWTEMAHAEADSPAVWTGQRAAAMVLYGPAGAALPRAALHPHWALRARMAALDLLLGEARGEHGLLWAPADWAAGALFDVALPALALGIPLLTSAEEPRRAPQVQDMLARSDLRHAVLPEEMLAGLRDASTAGQPMYHLRSLSCLDAPLPAALRDWARSTFGIAVREALIAPEAGLLLAGGAEGWRAPAGRSLAVLAPDGTPLPAGRQGRIALDRGDDGLMLGYWREPSGHRGPWRPTAARGVVDSEGGLWPWPRAVADARAEVEACLRQHPAVARVALIGEPDLRRAAQATAVVVPHPDARPGPDLAAELRAFLRARLATEDCPSRVAFARALPETLDGPAMRGALDRTIGLGALGPGA